MSVSGYVSKDYQLEIASPGKDTVQLPHCSVVTELSVLRSLKKKMSPIKVPCIIQGQVYELAFTLNTAELKEHIPSNVQADQVHLLFYKKILSSEVETECSSVIKIKKRHNHIVITNNTIKGTIRFAAYHYRTTEENSCLQMALKIGDVILKHLVCDIAVFTNTKQITPKYELALGTNSQSILESTFWYSKATFIDPPKPKRKISDSSELTESTKEPEEQEPLDLSSENDPIVKKQLTTVIKATQDGLNALKNLSKSNRPYSAEDISKIVAGISTTYAPLLSAPVTEIPEVPLFSTGNFIDSPFFDPLFETKLPQDLLCMENWDID